MTAILKRYLLLILVISFSFNLPVWAAPKNVIFLIGDGMGFEQVKAAGIYANGQAGTLLYESFPYQAQVTTHSADSSLTDSAAGSTAMATGTKVNNGVISMSIPGDNSELYTLLEYFRDQGKRTGLVTTTYISHATPAAFGSHETNRSNYTAIVSDYLTQTKPDVLFGGAKYMSSTAAESAGYTVVINKSELQSLNTETVALASGQFGNDNMPYKYDGTGYDTLPDLSEMTLTALAILDGDPDGFFIMIEGGRIDHAGHENNIARNIFETIDLNDTVATILTWAEGRSDTLIILTADHETGGLSVLSNNGQGVLPDVSWSTTGHTAVNVPVYAVGENANLVSGTMDNTDFFDLVTFSSTIPVNYYCDEDMDGYASSSISGSCTGTGCEPVDCNEIPGTDCDDSNGLINHGEAEICNDEIDNDCDGETDESDTNCQICVPGATHFCDTGHQGVCEAGTETCGENGFLGACVQNVQPSAEICDDSLDNDCDGTIDYADINCSTNSPPSVPQLSYPSDNQLNVETTIGFKWEKCTDADGDAITYDLHICQDKEMMIGCIHIENAGPRGTIDIYYAVMGAGLFLFGMVFTGGVGSNKKLMLILAIMIIVVLSVSCGSSGGGNDYNTSSPHNNEVVQVISGLKANTVYYWKVIVDDDNGGIVESNMRSFTT